MEYVNGDSGINCVECCRLFDGKLSVRVNGREVGILPNRLNVTPCDLESVIVAALIENGCAHIKDSVKDAVKDAEEEVHDRLSTW